MSCICFFLWFLIIGTYDFIVTVEGKDKAVKGKASVVSISDVLVVIRNMHYRGSVEKARKIKQELEKTAKSLDEGKIDVLMLHEEWASYGAWTIVPILERLSKKYEKLKKWIYFCEDTTQVDLKGVLGVFSRFKPDQKWLLGHALHDHEVSIIHHFAFHQNLAAFKFPDFDAGWAMSIPLLKHTVGRLRENPIAYGFSIDVKHEVAKYIYDDGKGTSMTDIPEFCINTPLNTNNCVSTVLKEIPNCGLVDPDDIFVAVKTCEKYHKERVPIVQKTMGKHAKHIRYYSDKVDDNIPTEYINVKNTEKGHCQKLHNIIKKAATEEWKNKKWLVVIDDDTIMSFDRLRRHLACYDESEPILLGERYGYGINHMSAGYEYPTGGGGMILNRAAINRLINSNCNCHAPDAPDDMWLGMCFRRFGIPMVHSNSLHQARSSQYNPDFLSHRYLVSFHKHFMVDPMQVYAEYLEDKETNNNQEKNEL